jgi:hypothetical protein
MHVRHCLCQDSIRRATADDEQAQRCEQLCALLTRARAMKPAELVPLGEGLVRRRAAV